MRWIATTFNIFGPVFWGIMLYAGITGRVSWWVIALIALSDLEINIKLRRE